MNKFKKRGCCKHCKSLKDGLCKHNHTPTRRGNSTIYVCGFQDLYAKEKDKQGRKQHNELVKELDKVFGNFIRYRDKGKCITCEAVFHPSERMLLHPGHYISRKRMATRFDERNVFAQCRNCNGKQNHDGNGMMLEEILKQNKLTLDEVEVMRIKSNKTRKFEGYELEEMIAEYKIKLDFAKQNFE